MYFHIPVFNNSVELLTEYCTECRSETYWSVKPKLSLVREESSVRYEWLQIQWFYIFIRFQACYVTRHLNIHTVCRAYETFYINEPPIPTQLLAQALRLILQENSFQFNGKNYLQTHDTAMGTKMAGAFSNIFTNKIETESLAKAN